MNKIFTDYLGELIRQLLDTNHDVTIAKNGTFKIICDEKVIEIPLNKFLGQRTKMHLNKVKLKKKLSVEKDKYNSYL